MIVHLHDQLLDPLIIRLGGEDGIFLIVFQTLFIFINEVKELLVVSTVRLLEFTGADLQEEIAVMLAVGVDLTFFEDIEAHEVEPDQVHCVFVEMLVVLFTVALAEFGVLADNSAEVRIHLFEIAKRIMLEVTVNEDLGVHALGYTPVDIQADRITGNISVLQAEVFKDRFTGAEDMAFLFILGVVVMRQGVLQTAQLLVGIAAECMNGSLRPVGVI